TSLSFVGTKEEHDRIVEAAAYTVSSRSSDDAIGLAWARMLRTLSNYEAISRPSTGSGTRRNYLSTAPYGLTAAKFIEMAQSIKGDDLHAVLDLLSLAQLAVAASGTAQDAV